MKTITGNYLKSLNKILTNSWKIINEYRFLDFIMKQNIKHEFKLIYYLLQTI